MEASASSSRFTESTLAAVSAAGGNWLEQETDDGVRGEQEDREAQLPPDEPVDGSPCADRKDDQQEGESQRDAERHVVHRHSFYLRLPCFLKASRSAGVSFTTTSAGFEPPFALRSVSTPRDAPDPVTSACFFSARRAS